MNVLTNSIESTESIRKHFRAMLRAKGCGTILGHKRAIIAAVHEVFTRHPELRDDAIGNVPRGTLTAEDSPAESAESMLTNAINHLYDRTDFELTNSDEDAITLLMAARADLTRPENHHVRQFLAILADELGRKFDRRTEVEARPEVAAEAGVAVDSSVVVEVVGHA